jgi:hypothetical protein
MKNPVASERMCLTRFHALAPSFANLNIHLQRRKESKIMQCINLVASGVVSGTNNIAHITEPHSDLGTFLANETHVANGPCWIRHSWLVAHISADW